MTKGKVLRPILIVFLIFVFIGFAASSVYFFMKYQDVVAKDPSRELELLMKKISKFMDVPSESPQLATVTDKDKLTEAGFKKVENGDKILFFIQTGQAIVYRPSTGRVVEVIPIRINNQQATSSAETLASSVTPVLTPGDEKALSVTFYNGTATKGLSTKAEAELAKAFSEMSVADRAIASKVDYAESIVVDLTGTNSKDVQALATLFKGKVSELPAGEFTPVSDILVILGKSFVDQLPTPTITITPTVTTSP